ncbi:hypothetical protein DFH07DRAFT_969607 [Mycena maculata]|uniref:AAA+ ATPase domain-containing protein n=1 Tax=Mycena maculata TaxID=230809 RepID=A0AAD7MST0_9AGAR|nr:hypothetical protein DFH07DRAFT_969607 [Mycena maculata]
MTADFEDELAFLETATPVEQDTNANLLRHQLVTSPLLTYSALKHRVEDFPSRGLLGTNAGDRVYVNTNAPSSVVICGVQGSGKSHSVSCLLECALIPDSRIGQLPEPLSALVFTLIRKTVVALARRHSFRHRPLIALLFPGLRFFARAYCPLSRTAPSLNWLPTVRVEPLSLSEKDLTADRMLAIMGCDNLDTMPLYMHIALLIIRNMGVDEFSYQEFKRRIGLERLDPKQQAMIKLRLDLLDAFIQPGAPEIESYFTAGGLVLVDLTDPFLDVVVGLTTAVLFDTVLGTFTQWRTICGKLVVLDEAHQYLTNSDSARLTHSVSNIIRLQRHLATRVIIATQEPTVIPPTILGLASIIICHRFSSPAWCTHLARHVSAGNESSSWYQQVMLLPTGDALVFSPAAAIAADERGGVVLLGRDHIRLRVRPRLTLDGGASRLAVGRSLTVHAGSSGGPPPSLPTPPTSESSLPAQQETHLEDTSSAPSVAAPYLTPTLPGTTPSAALSASATSPSDGPVPSAPSVESTISAQRAVPARLQHLVGWLSRSGGADAPLRLVDAHNGIYATMRARGRSWWTNILQEAVNERLVELINMEARGDERMIRLIERGPLLYV